MPSVSVSSQPQALGLGFALPSSDNGSGSSRRLGLASSSTNGSASHSHSNGFGHVGSDGSGGAFSSSGGGTNYGGGSGDGAVMTVAEIKETVQQAVRSFRKASCLPLLRSAQDHAVQGFALESSGDQRGAFRALLTAAQLTQAVLQHPEFQEEKKPGKRGAVYKEFMDFQQAYSDIAPKAKELQERLLSIEKSRGNNISTERTDAGELPASSSVQERVRALQEKGLNVSTKRISRDFSSSHSPTFSATSPSLDWKASANAIARSPSAQEQHLPSAGSRGHAHTSSTVTNQHTGSSIHSIIAAPSSLGAGPSSPLSEKGSPRFNQLSLSEFTSHFPSIDELDEGMNTLHSLPSVPKYKPGSNNVATPILKSPPISPSIVQRFPSLPLNLDPGPRPASTPIPPVHGIPSRPASPSRIMSPTMPSRSPLSPTVPPKPIKLQVTGSSSSARNSPLHTGAGGSNNNNNGAGISAVATNGSGSSDSPRSRGIELPVTSTLFPKTLREYIGRPADVRVLLIDVRTREEFTRCHIKTDAAVCLEPHVIERDGMTSDKIEDALALAPPHEYALFRNRDAYDLVVLADADSETFGPPNAPLATAARIIFEMAYQHKPLKRPPLILVGGLKAWKAAYPNDVVQEMGVGLEAQMDRMKLYSSSPGMNGSAYTSYTPPSNSTDRDKEREPMSPPSSTDLWHPTSAGSRSSRMDQIPEHDGSKSSGEIMSVGTPERRLVRKAAMMRPPSTSSISYNVRGLYETTSPYGNTAHASSSSSIVYPQYPRQSSSFASAGPPGSVVSPPPTASINPSLTRRRTSGADSYVDQSEQAVSAFSGSLRSGGTSSIDYPSLATQHVVRPPPAVASPPSERQDQRRGSVQGHGHRMSLSGYEPPHGPRPPLIGTDYSVTYWPENTISTSGLKNLGNTCYMNSTIQCLSATVPFSRFFTEGRWKNSVNMVNPLGTKGQLTSAFALILRELWQQDSTFIVPNSFRRSICSVRSGQQFAGSEQHDCQEFLNFLLDGLHEDLNRVLHKETIAQTPEREAELETLPKQIASQQEWDRYRARDNSIVVDFFQGQFRNRMQCLTCRKTSTTYNSFMYLTLPIPSGRHAKATLHQCLDAFVSEEVMEKEDAWNCPNCKALQRATKQLSLSRLPPVLLIHLKRFTTKGHFTDKLETFVDFPLKSLDLTNYMPPPLPPGIDRKRAAPISLDDPRTQVPPYRYDLYAVTNHFGTLSSGHYTAFINSRGNWLYCDDSRISSAEAREVVGKPAYVLYYKRVQS